MSIDTSTSLLDQLAAGNDPLAWDRFVQIYQPFIQRQIQRCGVAEHDADDLAQESLATTFVALAKFAHNGRTGAFRNWLRSIVVQRVSKYRRRRKQFALAVSSDRWNGSPEHEWQNDLEESWEREHDQYILEKLLQWIESEFAPTTWLAFQQQVFEGKSPQRTADALGLTVNAVTIAKSRVLRRLRQLGQHLIDDS